MRCTNPSLWFDSNLGVSYFGLNITWTISQTLAYKLGLPCLDSPKRTTLIDLHQCHSLSTLKSIILSQIVPSSQANASKKKSNNSRFVQDCTPKLSQHARVTEWDPQLSHLGHQLESNVFGKEFSCRKGFCICFLHDWFHIFLPHLQDCVYVE